MAEELDGERTGARGDGGRTRAEVSWEKRRLHAISILRSHHLHALIALIVFVDVTCVACELMLRDVCVAPQDSDISGRHRMESWQEGLAWTSRGLVFILFAREVLLAIIKGYEYFKSLGHIADLVILTVAVGLEIGMLVEEGNKANQSKDHLDKEAGVQEAGSILVILLAWRVVRVLHGLYLTAEDAENELDEAEVKELRTYIKDLEERVKELSPERSLSLSGTRMHV